MSQIHDRRGINLLIWDDITNEEREEIIDSLLLIEEKRNADLKG